jgi:hypothetical protein
MPNLGGAAVSAFGVAYRRPIFLTVCATEAYTLRLIQAEPEMPKKRTCAGSVLTGDNLWSETATGARR